MKKVARIERRMTAIIIPNAIAIINTSQEEYLFASITRREEAYQGIEKS